jgi:hypothetical protein
MIRKLIATDNDTAITHSGSPGRENLSNQRNIRLALADEVMFLRPQSLLTDPQEVEATPDSLPGLPTAQPSSDAITALLDGLPVQAPMHSLPTG